MVKTGQEIAEVRRIQAKIRELGWGSLTRREEDIINYSPYGNAAGCPSVNVGSTSVPPDYPPSEADE